jgi:UDP-3-O-[3-hydroxymyristoyl] glucosamine N-acyltransferase
MRTIDVECFLSFLTSHDYYFLVDGDINDSYKIASIINPINTGFYFFSKVDFSLEVKNSLILVHKRTIYKKEYGNCFISVEVDPQIIYYRFLETLYGQKSDGFVSPSSKIDELSEIEKNVQIGNFSIIGKCTLEENVIIGHNCIIEDNSIIKRNTIIESGSIIGTQGVAWVWNEDETRKIRQPQIGGVVIEENCFLAANTIVVRGSLNEYTTIKNNTFIAPGCRIGHGTVIGMNTHFANNVVTGGNTVIGENSFVGSNATFRPKVRIHHSTIVGAGAVVVKNTSKAGITLVGVPAIEKETSSKPSGMPKQVFHNKQIEL